MRELAVKVVNQFYDNKLVLIDLHELLAQYGKFKTNSPTVGLSVDKLTMELFKQSEDLEDIMKKQQIKELLSLGFEQIIQELSLNTLTTKEGKIIYV